MKRIVSCYVLGCIALVLGIVAIGGQTRAQAPDLLATGSFGLSGQVDLTRMAALPACSSSQGCVRAFAICGENFGGQKQCIDLVGGANNLVIRLNQGTAGSGITTYQTIGSITVTMQPLNVEPGSPSY